jgi:hypothetical protein
MKNGQRELFAHFGRLDTWVVGIQYYDGAKSLDSPEVFFDRDPDNPFDPDAVAVFTRSGQHLGHLPRYDAEYLSPLIAEGATELARSRTRGRSRPVQAAPTGPADRGEVRMAFGIRYSWQLTTDH